MASIPGFGSIQLPQIRPSNDVAVAPLLRAGTAGNALAGFGDAVADQAGAADNAQKELGYAQARSAFLQSQAALKTSFENDQDWKTLPQRYQDGAQKSLQDAANTISSPTLRARFLAESGVDLARGVEEISGQANGQRKDQGRATMLSTLDGNRQAALASPAQANSLIQASNDAITAAQGSGFISAQEAQEQRQHWTSEFGKGYLETLPPAQRLKVLTGSNGVSPQAGAVSSGDIHAAIIGQESGGDPNAPTSVTGAVGPGQVEPETFARFAKPGEKITNAADNTAVSGRYVDYLSGLPNVKGDPGRIAVGYFSGEKNIAPAGSATPYIKDARDPNGKSTSSYVADVLGRLNGSGGASPSVANPDDVVAVPKTNTPADFVPLDQRAEMARTAARQVQEGGAFNRQQVASDFDDSVAWLRSGGDPAKATVTPEALFQSLGPLQGARAAAQLADAQQYGANVKALALAPQGQIDQILTSEAPTGPKGFIQNARNFDDLRSIAAARNTALNADPAGYVVHNDPGTAAAYQNAQKDPASFAAYAQKLNSVYDLMQVPGQMRSIIPQADAKAMVSKIETGSPSDVAKTLQSLQATTGKYWGQAYAGLAKAGMPAWVQAVSVANPADQPTMVAALQHTTDKGFKGYGDLVSKEETEGTPMNPSPLDTALTHNLSDLKASMTAYGQQGLSTYQGVEKAVRTTAMYLMAKDPSLTGAQAASRASGMVTGPFDFMQQPNHPPARIPKGSTAQVQASTGAVLAGLKPTDVRPYAALGMQDGGLAGSTAADRAGAAYDGAKSAWWLTVTGPDGHPMLRAIDPHTSAPVVLANGRTLDVPVNTPGQSAAAAAPLPQAPVAAVLSAPVYKSDRAVQRGEGGDRLKAGRR